MAKKKKEDLEQEVIIEHKEETSFPKMTAEMYWRWRLTVEEMNMADQKLKFGELQYMCIEKDIEIARLKAVIFKKGLKDLELAKEDSKKAYFKFKEEIEKELKVELKDVVIDDATFEIKKL